MKYKISYRYEGSNMWLHDAFSTMEALQRFIAAYKPAEWHLG